ncbi:DSPTP1, partial [Symbiodinium microadriaticum]
ILSFASNMTHASDYLSASVADAAKIGFFVDNFLILVDSAIQLRMCRRARQVLDEALPDWRNQMTGSGSGQSSPAREPLLEGSTPSQSRGGGSSFQPFSGSGQRLGAAGPSSQSRMA